MRGPSALRSRAADALRDAGAAWLGAGSHPGGTALSRRLLDRLDVAPGDHVLDLGCGRGHTLALLRARGVVAVGVDVDERRVQQAQRRLDRPPVHGAVVRPPAVLAVADAARLPLPDAALDAVVAECVVSTLDDPERALAEVRRVLRPGGVLALTDVTARPSLGGTAPDVRRAVDALTTPRPREGWVALVSGSGLEVLEVRDEPGAALETVRRARRRLAPATVLPVGRSAQRTAGRAEAAVVSGLLGYALVVARRPAA